MADVQPEAVAGGKMAREDGLLCLAALARQQAERTDDIVVLQDFRRAVRIVERVGVERQATAAGADGLRPRLCCLPGRLIARFVKDVEDDAIG